MLVGPVLPGGPIGKGSRSSGGGDVTEGRDQSNRRGHEPGTTCALGETGPAGGGQGSLAVSILVEVSSSLDMSPGVSCRQNLNLQSNRIQRWDLKEPLSQEGFPAGGGGVELPSHCLSSKCYPVWWCLVCSQKALTRSSSWVQHYPASWTIGPIQLSTRQWYLVLTTLRGLIHLVGNSLNIWTLEPCNTFILFSDAKFVMISYCSSRKLACSPA